MSDLMLNILFLFYFISMGGLVYWAIKVLKSKEELGK